MTLAVKVALNPITTNQSNLWFSQYSFQGLTIVIQDRIHSSLTTIHCFNVCYLESRQWLGKNIVWSTGLKKLRESMETCICHCNITAIMLKMALNTTSINQIF